MANNVTEKAPVVILVPCAESGRIGCQLVRRAVEMVAKETPEVTVATPEECERGTKAFLVAVDASHACQSSSDLQENGIKPSFVVSAPEVLAKTGLLKPGRDPRQQQEELAQGLAEGIRQSLHKVLVEARERGRYCEELAPVIQRFQGIWRKIDSLSPPNGLPSEQEKAAVELLGKRARNIFVRFDVIIPPSDWAESHDLFQDSMLCLAYATEGWAVGDIVRWQQNLEKARVQIQPLLRRMRI